MKEPIPLTLCHIILIGLSADLHCVACLRLSFFHNSCIFVVSVLLKLISASISTGSFCSVSTLRNCSVSSPWGSSSSSSCFRTILIWFSIIWEMHLSSLFMGRMVSACWVILGCWADLTPAVSSTSPFLGGSTSSTSTRDSMPPVAQIGGFCLLRDNRSSNNCALAINEFVPADFSFFQPFLSKKGGSFGVSNMNEDIDGSIIGSSQVILSSILRYTGSKFRVPLCRWSVVMWQLSTFSVRVSSSSIISDLSSFVGSHCITSVFSLLHGILSDKDHSFPCAICIHPLCWVASPLLTPPIAMCLKGVRVSLRWLGSIPIAPATSR